MSEENSNNNNNENEPVSFDEFHQRPSIEQPSICSQQFEKVNQTSTPKRRLSKVHFVNTGSGMLMSTSRQEFLPGEPNGGIKYGRQGGIFVSKFGIFSIFLLFLVLVAVTGLLVYFLAPCRNEKTTTLKDDVSFILNELNVKKPSTSVRLPSSVRPSLYRVFFRPNLTSYEFEGYVVITLSTSKSNVKQISLHASGLEILEDVVLSENQKVIKHSNALKIPTRKRRSIEEQSPEKSPEERKISEQTENNEEKKETEIPDVEKAEEKKEDVAEPKESSNVNENEPKKEEKPQVDQVLNNTTTPESKDENEERESTSQKTEVEEKKEDKDISSTVQQPPDITTEVSDVVSTEKPEIEIVHSKGMKKLIKIISKDLKPSNERLVLSLDSFLKPNVNYTLQMSFRGVIDDSLTGLYNSTYLSNNTTKVVAATQFEPTFARKVFPCFDEPDYKAQFEISILTPKNMTALSNMPLYENVDVDEDLRWSHFEVSPPMSTYLVAFVISDFEANDVTPAAVADEKPVKFKVWSRKELFDQTNYAAEIGPKIMNFFESYFGIPYPLPKVDLVALPSFAEGAMENWGLITFRETELLVNERSVSLAAKRAVTVTIAHEMAHQFISNLVTMRFWNELWLSESFATLMQYFCVNEIKPEWEMLNEFSLDKMQVLVYDSIESTRPVSSVIQNEKQISQMFDSITYMKAASLLRMLEQILTTEVFRDGLKIYLTKWQYKNVDQNDLWNALTSAAKNSTNSLLPENLSVKEIMDSWTLEAGYPVVTVKRNYKQNSITIIQKRFYFHESITNLKQLWHIPITYTFGNITESSIKTEWLTKTVNKTIKLPEEANSTWVYFNVNGSGHYRVNYDEKNWKKLQYALEDNPLDFPATTRAQLLDDAFNLAKAGQISYTIPLDLTKYMIKTEKDYSPWVTVLRNLRILNRGLQRTSHYWLFQDYISRLISPTLNNIGYSEKTNDTIQTIFLRDYFTEWACLIEDTKCISWAWDNFNQWVNQTNPDKNNPIPANSRSTVYATIVKMGSKKEFEFLFERYEKSNDPEIRDEIISILTNTRNTWQIYWLLEHFLQSNDAQTIPILWGSLNTDISTQIAFNFVLNNWNRIYDRFLNTDVSILTSIIAGAFGDMSTEHELQQFTKFVRANKDQLSGVSNVIYENIDNAVINIQWGKTKIDSIRRWLEKFAESKSTNKINEFSTL